MKPVVATFCVFVFLLFCCSCSPVSALSYGHGLRDLFMFAPGWTNLNHGSYGATPKSIIAAEHDYQLPMEAAPDKWFRYQYQGAVSSALAKLASFIGADPKDLVFELNASTSLNAVIRSLGNLGRSYLYLQLAYPVVPNAMQYMETVTGVPHIQVQISFPISDDGIVQAVAAALQGQKVGLCSFSHIVSVPGIILPIKRLAALCKSNGAHVMIDGAHALGQIPINVTDIGADFYLANGHKWLYSPKGSSILWASKQSQALLNPTVISMGLHKPFQDAFLWQGTMDYSPYLSMVDAMAFHQSLPGGSQGVFDYMHNLAVAGGRVLAEAWGTEALVEDNRIGAMVNIRLPSNCSATLAGKMADILLAKYNTWVPAFPLNQPGPQTWYMRASAQIYLELSDFRFLANAVLDIIRDNQQQ